MSAPKDGGQAFPCAVGPGVIGSGCGPAVEWGMTVRQYYKATALKGMLSDHEAFYGRFDLLAGKAGEIADAMLAEDAEFANK